jgi:TRAP-type mannitol/chloroaromatic compound transport system permease small subunit
MAWGAWQLAFNSFDVDERAVAAIRFQIWPIKIIFSFGITICVLQMFFDLLLKLSPSTADPTFV